MFILVLFVILYTCSCTTPVVLCLTISFLKDMTETNIKGPQGIISQHSSVGNTTQRVVLANQQYLLHTAAAAAAVAPRTVVTNKKLQNISMKNQTHSSMYMNPQIQNKGNETLPFQFNELQTRMISTYTTDKHSYRHLKNITPHQLLPTNTISWDKLKQMFNNDIFEIPPVPLSLWTQFDYHCRQLTQRQLTYSLPFNLQKEKSSAKERLERLTQYEISSGINQIIFSVANEYLKLLHLACSILCNTDYTLHIEELYNALKQISLYGDVLPKARLIYRPKDKNMEQWNPTRIGYAVFSSLRLDSSNKK